MTQIAAHTRNIRNDLLNFLPLKRNWTGAQNLNSPSRSGRPAFRMSVTAHCCGQVTNRKNKQPLSANVGENVRTVLGNE
jgi:hypothetical protein